MKEACEIGPGTGRYLERIILHTNLSLYHIYEIDPEWGTYLKEKLPSIIVNHKSDGKTLHNTSDGTCDLVSAFGVFVYLTPVHTFNYLKEMIRVCKTGGHIVFDCYLSDTWSLDIMDAWIASGNEYPILLPRNLIIDLFAREKCTCMYEFQGKYGAGHSDYLIFQKGSSSS